MAMKAIFDVRLEGRLDQPRLDRLRKLLNLTPRGRLTDTEDAEFGHRDLRDTPQEWVWLTLWRESDTDWHLHLTFAGPALPQPEIDECLAGVLGAAAALGLAVTRIWPEPAGPVPAPEVLRLPARKALSVRLDGGRRLVHRLDVPVRAALQRALKLRRELGETESGWRYVQWAPPRDSLLLQLFDGDGGTEVALLYDERPPSAEVVAECRRQIAEAATAAGMWVADSSG
jgi:hypothetical protein